MFSLVPFPRRKSSTNGSAPITSFLQPPSTDKRTPLFLPVLRSKKTNHRPAQQTAKRCPPLNNRSNLGILGSKTPPCLTPIVTTSSVWLPAFWAAVLLTPSSAPWTLSNATCRFVHILFRINFVTPTTVLFLHPQTDQPWQVQGLVARFEDSHCWGGCECHLEGLAPNCYWLLYARLIQAIFNFSG